MRMGNYARRLSRNSLCLLLKALCCDVANFLALKLVVDALGVSGYGTYAAVSGLVLVFARLNAVMESSVCRFLGRELGRRDGDGYAAVFTSALGLVMALAIAVVLLGETVGFYYFRHFLVVPTELSGAAGVAFHAGVVMVAALTMRTVFSAAISSCERMSVLAVFGLVEGLLSLVSAAMAFAFRGHGIEIYALSLSASSVLLLVGFAVYCFRRVDGVRIVHGFKGAATREIGAFFLWSTLNGIGNVFRYEGPSLLINRFAGVVCNAAWAVAFQVRDILYVIVAVFHGAIPPVLLRDFHERPCDFARLLMSSVRVCGVLSVIPAACVAGFAPGFLEWWLGASVPPMAVAFTRCAMVVLVADSLSYPFTATIMAGGRVVLYQCVSSALAVASFLAAWVLLRSGLPEWSALAAVAAGNVLALAYRVLHVRVFMEDDIIWPASR